jgi:hypothetical protein
VINLAEPPINEVIEMKQQGMSYDEITRNLTNQGYSSQDIYDAMNQSNIKSGIEAPPPPGMPPPNTMQPSALGSPGQQAAQPPQEIPEAPSPGQQAPVNISIEEPIIQTTHPQQQYMPTQIFTSDNEALIESIIDERWQNLIGKVGDISIWKERMKDDIESVKQELLRVEGRFDNLQKALLEEVGKYGQGISDVGSDIKALEKVMQKIIQPLTINVKELERITKKLKEKKS